MYEVAVAVQVLHLLLAGSTDVYLRIVVAFVELGLYINLERVLSARIKKRGKVLA